MSAEKKIDNKLQRMKGKAKQAVGELTDNQEWQVEGRAEQTGADLKDAGEKIKDAFRPR